MQVPGGISVHDRYWTVKVLSVRSRSSVLCLFRLSFSRVVGHANRFRRVMARGHGVRIVRATRARRFNPRVDQSVCAKTRTDGHGYYLLAHRWRLIVMFFPCIRSCVLFCFVFFYKFYRNGQIRNNVWRDESTDANSQLLFEMSSADISVNFRPSVVPEYDTWYRHGILVDVSCTGTTDALFRQVTTC